MSDKALENAVAIRDELMEKIANAEIQIKEWRAQAQRAERFIADWEEFSGQQAPQTAVSESAAVSVESARVKPRNPKKEDVADAALKIIRERGEPMSRDDLFDALQSDGVVLQGKNPPVILQTMLWRMQDRIVHLKGHGYWPREDAYMAAGYVDADEPEKLENNDVDLDDEAKGLI